MDPAIARILDANTNRASEALRVLEDFTRFALGDAYLTGRIKEIRHDIAGSLAFANSVQIVLSRDVPGDVGRELQTEREYLRSGPRDVAVAAAKRAAQSLRVLEEYAKMIDADAARRLERLRYCVYEIERALIIRHDGADRFKDVALYVIVTESRCAGGWLDTAAQTIQGGADCIQLREKLLAGSELLRRSRALLEICRPRGVPLILNDRVDVASAAGADGVHVGQDDLSVADVRRILGPNRVIGQSTHTIEQARSAMLASPDYIAVGPMFASETKPQDHVPGPELAAAVRQETSLSIIAIGGINSDNVEEVLATGVDGVCVCGAVARSRDVTAATAELKERISRALSRRCVASEPNGGD